MVRRDGGWLTTGPTSSERWPEVVYGAGGSPYVGGVVHEEAFCMGPRTVLSHGTVGGIPWSVIYYTTAPVGDWWDHAEWVPVGSNVEFFLGQDSEYGGGGGYAGVARGFDVSLNGYFFGSVPDIVAWVGFASDPVEQIELRSSTGEMRQVDLLSRPTGFPKMFLFFPPRDADLTVVAMDSGGRTLQEDALPHEEPGRGNCAVAVHRIPGHSDGRPPGWPKKDIPEFEPGEGLRRDDDFYLHVATFPIYVVSPQEWDGSIGWSGSGTRGADDHLDHVSFMYRAAGGDPKPAFEIVSEHLGDARTFPMFEWYTGEGEGPSWWPEHAHGNDHISNFISRFVRRERSEDEIGSRSLVGKDDITVAGNPCVIELWAFEKFPELTVARVQLPETFIQIHGWHMTAPVISSLARKLQRLSLNSKLLVAMKTAHER